MAVNIQKMAHISNPFVARYMSLHGPNCIFIMHYQNVCVCRLNVSNAFPRKTAEAAKLPLKCLSAHYSKVMEYILNIMCRHSC